MRIKVGLRCGMRNVATEAPTTTRCLNAIVGLMLLGTFRKDARLQRGTCQRGLVGNAHVARGNSRAPRSGSWCLVVALAYFQCRIYLFDKCEHVEEVIRVCTLQRVENQRIQGRPGHQLRRVDLILRALLRDSVPMQA